jgi:glutathione S-transferase
MILIGQYDSAFVRRVAIALKLYGMPFEHRPWSVFGDTEQIRLVHPLARVPTLLLDDGTSLADSHIILDYLDGLQPETARLFPVREPERHKALRIATLATGLGEKIVSLFYEKRLHDQQSEFWVTRCRAQISAILETLEQAYAGLGSGFWHGSHPGHADIAVAVMWRFLHDAHPGLSAPTHHPALVAHSARMEAMPVFQEIQQPFIPPA